MAPAPVNPAVLTKGPFTLEDARRAGVSRRQLQGKSWRHIGPALYAWVGWAPDSLALLKAISARLPAGAAFSGRTAAWLHGLDLPPCQPTEITVPDYLASSGWQGTTIRRRALEEHEVVIVRGLPVTSPLRTAIDLARDLPLLEAVAAVDMALHRLVVAESDLAIYSATHVSTYGAARLRRTLELVDPRAESPMETELRLLLVLAGLPRPEAQVALHDDNGRFLGRVDLYYPRTRLAVEYDGALHRNSLAEDSRRQNGLLAAGYRLLRFTAPDVRGTPEAVVAQVRAALAG